MQPTDTTPSDEQRAYAACRVLGHSWVHLGTLDTAVSFGGYGFVSRCSHCTTERTKWLVGSGSSAKARYKYPKGYATHGDDRLSSPQWRRVLIVSFGL